MSLVFVIRRLNLGKCIHYKPIHQMAPEEQESSKEYGKVKKVKKRRNISWVLISLTGC